MPNGIGRPLGFFPDKPMPRLYDRILEVLRVRHYSAERSEPMSTGFAGTSNSTTTSILVGLPKATLTAS